jgi:hypothetical protein
MRTVQLWPEPVTRTGKPAVLTCGPGDIMQKVGEPPIGGRIPSEIVST